MEQATSLHRDIDIELPASSAKHPHEDVKDVTLIPTLAQAPKKPNGNFGMDEKMCAFLTSLETIP
jgi:hypothetical protein